MNPASTTSPAYRFAFEYFDAAGRRLDSLPVELDFEPIQEWASFLGMRRGQLPPVQEPGVCQVVPLWHEDFGEPVCRALGTVLRRPGAVAPIEGEIPCETFAEQAESKALLLIERGTLARGDRFQYRLCAYPIGGAGRTDGAAGAPAAVEHMGTIRVESVAQPLPLVDTPLALFAAGADEAATQDAADPPLFTPGSILDEACALAEKAGVLETGGVLLGRLHRDSSVPEIFLEVTAQIPARHAVASEQDFAFTPETWAAADAALALRGSDELIVGWWHSHPRFCRHCPEERWRHCIYARPFFSADDVHLHRTCFPQGFQIALLISDLPAEGLTPAFFGWRAGRVVSRGHHVLAARPNFRGHHVLAAHPKEGIA